jgi:hypothetical protein
MQVLHIFFPMSENEKREREKEQKAGKSRTLM